MTIAITNIQRTLEHILLYNYGPQSCLQKSNGCNKLKFRRPAGSGKVGKTLGYCCPKPFLKDSSAICLGMSSKDNCTFPWD